MRNSLIRNGNFKQVTPPRLPGFAPLPKRGTFAGTGAAELNPRISGRAPMIDAAPALSGLSAAFRAIEIPANLTISAGSAAWYKLESLAALQGGQEFVATGVHFSLLPCDVTGDGDGSGLSSLAWGTTSGLGAAIVIGIDLPGALNTWEAGPGTVTGIDDASTMPAAARLARTRQRPWIHAQTFPSGQLADTQGIPWKKDFGRSFGGALARVTNGHSLDVSLVVARSFVMDQTNPAYLVGFADVYVSTAGAERGTAFNS